MRRRKGWRCSLQLLLLLAFAAAGPSFADEIRVAVASNFARTMAALARAFEAESGHHVTIIPGASGRLYAQIVRGAPFDAFFSADSERPEKLERGGHTRPGSRHVYARGKLVLWSADPAMIASDGRQTLADGKFERLAMANPKLAPYGRAALQVLDRLGLRKPLEKKIVRGENVGQTYQFVHACAADLGFVAASQLVAAKGGPPGSRWEIPQQYYDPIEQQAVLLTDSAAARAFFDWLKKETARAIVQRHGYETG